MKDAWKGHRDRTLGTTILPIKHEKSLIKETPEYSNGTHSGPTELDTAQ